MNNSNCTRQKSEILYDSSAPEGNQFYNTATGQFVSSTEADALSRGGGYKVVVGSVRTQSPTSSVATIIFDQGSQYWECYYNTETDSFLSSEDANTLVEVGLGRIVLGTIPYVIIANEDGTFLDVVRNQEISEQEAESLVQSGTATLKRRTEQVVDNQDTNNHVTDDNPVSQSLPDYETATTSPDQTQPPTLLEIASNPGYVPTPSPPKDASQRCRHVAYTPEKPPESATPRPPASVGADPSRGAVSGSGQRQRSFSTLKDVVVPIAAGVGVAAVAIAGVAATMLLGGGKKKRRR